MIPPFPPRGNATIRVVRRAVHDIDVYKEAAPDNVQRVRLADKRVIQRPRKTLQYETPAERFHHAVALTG